MIVPPDCGALEGLMKKSVVYLLVAFSLLGSISVALELASPAFAGEQKAPPSSPK
jgi:hypothetical protein